MAFDEFEGNLHIIQSKEIYQSSIQNSPCYKKILQKFEFV